MALTDQIVESQTLTDSSVAAATKTFASVSVTQDDGAGTTGRYMLGALVAISSSSAGVTIDSVTYGTEELAPDAPGEATAASRPATRSFTAGEWTTGGQNLVVEVSGGNIDAVVVFLYIIEEVADECLPPYGASPRTDTFNRLSLNPMWTFDPADNASATFTFSQSAGIIRGTFNLPDVVGDYGEGSGDTRSPNISQAVSNVDFDVTAHLEQVDTAPGNEVTSGIHAEKAADSPVTYIRTGFYTFGSAAHPFVDLTDEGTFSLEEDDGNVGAASSAYQKFGRATNAFTGSYSTDGTSFTDHDAVSLTFTVARLGVNFGIWDGSATAELDVFEFINNDNAARDVQDAQTALEFLSDTAASATSISLAFAEDTNEGAGLINIAIIAADDAAGTMSAGTGDDLLDDGVVTSTDGIRYAVVGALTEVSGTTAGTTIGSTWTGAANASAAGAQFRVEELPAGGASGAATVPLPTAAGTSTAIVDGAGAATVDLPALSGTSAVVVNSDGAASVTLPTASGTGTQVTAIDGDGAATVDLPTSSSSSNVEVNADGAAAIALPTSSSAGVAIVASDGTATVNLPTVSSASTVVVNADGGANVAVPAAVGSGSVETQVNGAGAATVELPTAAGTSDLVVAGAGAATINLPASSASSAVIVTGNGVATINLPASSATGSQGSVSNASGTASVALPTASGSSAVVIDGTGASSAPLPTLSASSAIIVSGDGSASVTLPAAAGAGGLAANVGDGAPAVDLPTASGVSTVIANSDGASAVGLPVLSAGATVIVNGDGSMTILSPVASGSSSEGVFPTVALKGSFTPDVTLKGTHRSSAIGGSFGSAA